MFFVCHALYWLLLSSPVTVAAARHIGSDFAEELDKQAGLTTFKRLLDQVSPQALHAALHDFNPGKFKYGSFARDREAAEAVHQHDPDYASSMVIIAKRQSGNSSTSAEPDPDTSTPPATEIPGTLEPTPGTSTLIVTEAPPPPSTVVVSVTSNFPAAPTPTPNNNEPSAIAPDQTNPGIPSTTGGSDVPSSADTADTTSVSRTERATTSGSRTRIIVQTTTLANGGVETVTAVTFISGEASATDGSADVSATSPIGSLQSEGLAYHSRSLDWKTIGFVGGAIGFAFAL